MANIGRLSLSNRDIVISLDPGVTTGYSILKRTDNKIEILEVGEFKTWSGIESLIRATRKRFSRDRLIIVYENFVVRTYGVNTVALEVIGVLKYLSNKNQLPLYSQEPAERQCIEKWYKSDFNKFPALPTTAPAGHDPHYRSAMKHGIYFILNKFHAKKPQPFSWSNLLQNYNSSVII